MIDETSLQASIKEMMLEEASLLASLDCLLDIRKVARKQLNAKIDDVINHLEMLSFDISIARKQLMFARRERKVSSCKDIIPSHEKKGHDET